MAKRKTSLFRVELKQNQKQVLNFLKSNEISILTGMGGTGKDFIQLYRAIEGLYNGEFEKIVFMKPITEMGQRIGFLPGAQPYSSKIYTPKGFTTMGEVKKGDTVYAYDGKPVKVLDTFEQGERDIYEVKTSDSQTTLVCDKHLWTVEERRAKTAKYRKPITIDTLTIKNNLFNNYGKYRYSIPRNSAIEWEEKDLEIDPYVLGVLIGDGSLSKNVHITNPDFEIIEKVDSLLKETEVVRNYNNLHHNIKTSKFTNNKTACKIKIVDLNNKKEYIYNRVGEVPYKQFKCNTLNSLKYRCYNKSTLDGFSYDTIKNNEKYTNPIKNKLDRLNLLYKKSYEKFIPNIYKFSSINQRLELVRGMLDTDGNVKTNGETIYTTTSKKLAEDLAFVIRSLGGRVFIKERNRVGYGSYHKDGHKVVSRRLCYEVRINFKNNPSLFYLKRKKEREKPTSNLHKNNIVSVNKVGREKVKCILIDHPEHLYITDDFIVTHNTEQEKLDPYVKSCKDNINKMVDKNVFNGYSKKIEFQATSFLRGNSIEYSAVILSEAQNLTLHELISVTTRISHNSKLYINGDMMQSDIGRKSGFKEFIEIVKDVDGVGIKNLGEEFQMRNKIIVDITKNYQKYLNK